MYQRCINATDDKTSKVHNETGESQSNSRSRCQMTLTRIRPEYVLDKLRSINRHFVYLGAVKLFDVTEYSYVLNRHEVDSNTFSAKSP